MGLPGTPTAAPVDRQRLACRRDRERTLRRWAAARCLAAIDTARMWDACAHRQSLTGRLERAAYDTPSDATLDALAHVYRLRDRADRDAEWFAADNWRGLVAIADRCGPEWGRRARAAAVVLSGTDLDEGDAGILLLTDIRTLFVDDPEADRLPTDTLLHRLCALPERPWGEWRRGKPLTVRGSPGC